MKRDDFRRAVPDMPQHFIQKMNATLGKIEEMERSRYPSRRIARIVAVALAILMIVGTAAAATNFFGLLDYARQGANGPKPLEGAENLIQSEFGDGWTCANGVVEVREAVYTGNTYSVLLHTSFETMFPEWDLTNAEAGSDSLEYASNEGGMDFILGGSVLGDAPETLRIEISIPLYQEGKVLEPLMIPLELKRSGGESIELRPVTQGTDWQILQATFNNSGYTSTLDVIFRCETAADYEMGVDILLFDAQEERIEMGEGTVMEPLTLEDGTTAYHCCSEVQSFEMVPERVYLQAKVIGEEKWLDRIACDFVLQ